MRVFVQTAMQEGIIPSSHQLQELCVAGRNYRGGMPSVAIIPSIDPAQIFALHGAGGVSAMSCGRSALADKPRSWLAAFSEMVCWAIALAPTLSVHGAIGVLAVSNGRLELAVGPRHRLTIFPKWSAGRLLQLRQWHCLGQVGCLPCRLKTEHSQASLFLGLRLFPNGFEGGV